MLSLGTTVLNQRWV